LLPDDHKLLQRTYIFLPKLLNYIQDSIEFAKVVQFMRASLRSPPCRGSASGPRWGTYVPRSPLYVHPFV